MQQLVNAMDILLTFTGFQDPYALGLVEEDEQPGPILSLAAARHFDFIVLISTPATETHTAETKRILTQKYPATKITIIDLPLSDPTSYHEIMTGLKEKIRPVIDEYPSSNFYISVASGTPQMHASWVLLTSSGEIPGRLLYNCFAYPRSGQCKS